MKFSTSDWLYVLVISLALSFTVGGGVVGGVAPFKADKLCVLVVEETAARTRALDAIYGAVEAATKKAGGDYRILDKDQSNLSLDSQWVQDAFKLKGPPPWIVAADKWRGVNQSLPTSSPADAVKILSPLGVK